MSEKNKEPEEQEKKNLEELAKKLGEEAAKGKDVSPMQSQHIEKEKLQIQIFNEFKQFEQTINSGVEELFKAIAEMAKHEPTIFSPELGQEIAGLVRFVAELHHQGESKYTQSIEEGKTIQEICSLSNETMDQFYRAAAYLYGREEHAQALSIFGVLVFLNPKESLYWLGLGNCAFFLSHYPVALQAYAACILVNPLEYRSQLYSARCYEMLNEIELAINALDVALVTALGQEEVIKQINEEKKRLEIKRKAKGG